ncbi:hypothetical protein [Robertmurraya sp. FSL R5-0851]|uniref:hypothetical protein n=1 Tax=Robertmurraya sp. FSL R5-0851 TaxID=2921584 RepID=UPI0030F6D3A1
MKLKYVAFLFFLVLILGACSNQSNTDEGTKSEEKPTTTGVVTTSTQVLMTFSNVQNLTVLIVLKLTDSLSKNEREAVHMLP